MEICHHIVAATRARHNRLAMQLASLLRGMLVLLLAALIAGALLISSTVVQSNIHTFLGPNGTEYVALQWATQLQSVGYVLEKVFAAQNRRLTLFYRD